ncbi:uncharacterized protein LOC133736848 [Rosa rugosa]|uniref:uncharacterized protein LOC133736848 n=1 Tax=Rosa rugosa TaxID=74645 RepID=UPI002B4072BA|nr:uncharacterized protein LOC133736848 [Rosa rugosa]
MASESCFSTRGRVIDCFRSSLTPKTVEGLICMQNWLLGDDIAEVVDDCSIENLEFYEEVEKDHESTASSKTNVCPAPIPREKGKGKLEAVGIYWNQVLLHPTLSGNILTESTYLVTNDLFPCSSCGK